MTNPVCTPVKKNDRYIGERVLPRGRGWTRFDTIVKTRGRERERGVDGGGGRWRGGASDDATIFAYNAGNTVNSGIFLLINRFVWVR